MARPGRTWAAARWDHALAPATAGVAPGDGWGRPRLASVLVGLCRAIVALNGTAHTRASGPSRSTRTKSQYPWTKRVHFPPTLTLGHAS
jgi:hypothetical protein